MRIKNLFYEVGYDPVYIKIKNEICPWHAEAKDYFQRIYENYYPYLDTNFANEFARDLYARLWELTLINYLGMQVGKGANLLLPPKDNRSRPDFCFIYNNKKYYIEATCAGIGLRESLNIPFADLEGKARATPIIEYKESLASALRSKGVEQYNKGYKNNIEIEAGFIVAISMSKIPLWHQPMNFDVDLSCLFSMSDLKIPFTRNGQLTRRMGQPYYDYQENFNNRNGSPILTNYLTSEKFNYISAVLISYCDQVFFPDIDKYQECTWGDFRNDFFLIHNPFAKVPLPQGFLPVSLEANATIKNDSIIIHLND